MTTTFALNADQTARINALLDEARSSLALSHDKKAIRDLTDEQLKSMLPSSYQNLIARIIEETTKLLPRSESWGEYVKAIKVYRPLWDEMHGEKVKVGRRTMYARERAVHNELTRRTRNTTVAKAAATYFASEEARFRRQLESAVTQMSELSVELASRLLDPEPVLASLTSRAEAISRALREAQHGLEGLKTARSALEMQRKS